jgi:DNA polymerase-4
VLVHPHHNEYEKFSKLVNGIYRRYTDLVEPFGIDESWLDVTGTVHLFGGGRQIADTIRKVVFSETGLTISAGVSFNKVFAKLGSDYKKPDATTVIDRNNFKEIIFPLPVSDLLYVGKAAYEILSKLYIKTIGDLARSDKKLVISKLGKTGELIHDYANGLDDSLVKSVYDERDVKSVGNGMTFKRDLTGLQDIRISVMTLSDSVASRMRHNGVKCQTVQVTLRDPQFKTISRQKALKRPTYLAKDISCAAMEIIAGSWNPRSPIRMLTITGTGLVPAESFEEQISFFDDFEKQDKQEQLETAIDRIREKFGKGSISFGSAINNDLGINEPSHDDS